MPGLSDVEAAWHDLPPETRDRIGVAAVDMVFQAFVHGDGYAPEDRAALDDAIRAAAFDASNARLNELHAVIEAELPDLFGADGYNPAWSENAGAEPCPAAMEVAAAEREAEAVAKRDWALLDALYPERAADDAMAIAMWRSRAREAEASRCRRPT